MYRKVLYTITALFGCMLFCGLVTGCISENYGEEHTDDGMQPRSYVSLSLVSASGSATRANPTGGEQGDGSEEGQDYENRITKAVAFFFQSDAGINGDADIPILAIVPFSFSSAGENGTYTTDPRPITLENGTYRVLVVANPGIEWWSGRELTLGDVRDYIQTQAWNVSGSDPAAYSDFVMTSAHDAEFTLDSNPQDNPATATVMVERMAARLDYKADASYTCTDPAYRNATVEITGAALVNNLIAGSYLMKRVAKDVSGTDLSYLGDETLDDQGVASNYVLDPWTSGKTAANHSFIIGGISGRPVSDLYRIWFENGSADPKWWAEYVKTGTEVSDGKETWYRIGYTLENTTDADEAGTRYSTGVVFKATFHPEGISNYKDGNTFFAYGSRLYASMEDMMAAFYGSRFHVGNAGFAGLKNCRTWGEVKDFVSSELVDNDPSGYDDFLKKELEGKTDEVLLTEADHDRLDWKNYMMAECGYSAAKNGGVYAVTLDQNQKVTRMELKQYGVRTYEKAVCYYTWWVRHSNDHDATKKGIMEYAIVRNNIYKLTVNSIYSLGSEVPEMDENILLDIYVKDWLLLPEEVLPM